MCLFVESNVGETRKLGVLVSNWKVKDTLVSYAPPHTSDAMKKTHFQFRLNQRLFLLNQTLILFESKPPADGRSYLHFIPNQRWLGSRRNPLSSSFESKSILFESNTDFVWITTSNHYSLNPNLPLKIQALISSLIQTRIDYFV